MDNKYLFKKIEGVKEKSTIKKETRVLLLQLLRKQSFIINSALLTIILHSSAFKGHYVNGRKTVDWRKREQRRPLPLDNRSHIRHHYLWTTNHKWALLDTGPWEAAPLSYPKGRGCLPLFDQFLFLYRRTGCGACPKNAVLSTGRGEGQENHMLQGPEPQLSKNATKRLH